MNNQNKIIILMKEKNFINLNVRLNKQFNRTNRNK